MNGTSRPKVAPVAAVDNKRHDGFSEPCQNHGRGSPKTTTPDPVFDPTVRP